MTDLKDQFIYQNPEDSENEIRIYLEDDMTWEPEHIGWLCVSVTEEKAVDSYNATFACEIYLPIDIAKKLRDYLNDKF